MKTTLDTDTHYVYRITCTKPKDSREYYIGVHSDKNPDSLNDGYMGSSKYLDEAINEIGGEYFTKEILSTWDTRKLAVQEEIRLHNIFDVATNPIFYNRAKQTSTGFDRKGVKDSLSTIEKKREIGKKLNKEGFFKGYKHSDKSKLAIKNNRPNNKLEKNPNAITVRIYDNYDNLRFMCNGGFRKFCIEHKLPYSGLRDSYIHNSKRIYQSKSNKTQAINRGYGEYIGWRAEADRIITNSTLEKMKNKKVGSKAKNALKINIYNNDNELQFECNGNFSKICNDNQLPLHALKKSYRNGATRLFQSTQAKTRAKKNDTEFYIGWYAKLV